MLKHVRWEMLIRGNHLCGLVAVRVEGERVQLQSLAGPDLPAEMLLSVLNAALPENWVEQAERLHRGRKEPWYLHTRVGMSGCRDYKLYSLRDEEFADWPLRAVVHVSMYGKLNGGLNCWLGDLPAILKEVAMDYGEATYQYTNAYEPSQGEIREPGSSSGLPEFLYAAERAAEMERICHSCWHFERDEEADGFRCNRGQGRCPHEKKMDQVWEGTSSADVLKKL